VPAISRTVLGQSSDLYRKLRLKSGKWRNILSRKTNIHLYGYKTSQVTAESTALLQKYCKFIRRKLIQIPQPATWLKDENLGVILH